MAILEDVPGIRATIYSNGERPEYLDDGEWTLKDHVLPQQGHRTSKYVQVVDEEFRINIEVTPQYMPSTDLSFVLDVDGLPVAMLRAKLQDMLEKTWHGNIASFVKRTGPSELVTRHPRFSTIKKGVTVNFFSFQS